MPTRAGFNVKADLVKVGETTVGQRMFAAALREIPSGSISGVIDSFISEIASGKEKLTSALLKKNTRDLDVELKTRGDTLHVACRPRDVLLAYRGVSFQAQVNSFLEEYDLEIAALVKGIAREKNLLPALFCEADLTKNGEPRYDGEVDQDVLQEAALARREAHGFVEDPEKASAPEIIQALTLQHRVLSSLDPTWKVELNFWLSQC